MDARIKAHRPYAPGTPHAHLICLTLTRGAKGTGRPVARGYLDPTRTDLPQHRARVRAAFEAKAREHDLTIVHFPKCLGPEAPK